MDREESVSTRQAWIIAVLLWASVVGLTATEIAPASVLTLVASDLGIGRTGVSWLVSVFLLGMVVAALPAGVLLDRVNNRHVVLVVAVFYLLSTGWTTLAAESGDLASLLAARFLGGVANVTIWTAAINVVGTVFGPTRQGTSIGFITTSIPVGFAVAHTTVPGIAGAVGWESSFVVFGLLTLSSAAVFWIYVRDLPLRTRFETPARSEVGAVLRNPIVWAVAVLAFAAFSLNMFFNNWLPSYLVEQFGVGVAAGGLFAAAFPAVGALARFASGAMSDRLYGGRRKPIVLGSFLVIAPLIVVIAGVRSIVVLLVLLVVAGFVTQMGLALLLPYVRELVDPNVAATSVSILNLVGLTGAFSAPVLTGFLIDLTGAYTAAFAYATGLALLGILVAWLAPEPG
ncbi:MAG: MFS transporter [Haloarculaceae archaeon]